jgi:beta-mannosidase
VDLNGTWRAVPSDETNRRTFAEPNVDDSGWEPIAVPSHWRSTPAFAASDGPLLYRTSFDAPKPEPGTRAWLVFDGLFYQGDVWLDGAYLGDTEGYFNRQTFEVTEDLTMSTDHVLGVELTCAPQDDPTSRRNITGAFQLDESWNPGGIWRDVRIETTGPVRARSLRVVCTEATTERAVLACRAELDTDAARSVTLRTNVAGVDQQDERPLAEGSNFVEWQVSVPKPALWWPHALGDQPLHEVTVEVCVEDEVSHRVGRRTGFRALQWKRWTLSVNGERLFLKGAHLSPTSLALGEATESELRRDIERARDAGLDLVRVHAHVSRPELYRAADELGMLVWQDFPLQWSYARSIRKQAKRQAAAMVDMLGHRPSIAIWCGHDAPYREGGGVGEVLGQQLPTFNKSILDRTVKRAIEKADPSRPVIAHSGVWPHVGSGGTDSHLEPEDDRELSGLARAFPRLVRFVGRLDGDRHAVEALRRLKYRPTGGFCHAGPIDDDLAAACRPVAVVCEAPPDAMVPGDTLALDVHVVSDLRRPLEGAVVEATVRWSGGEHTWRWGGDVPADDCVRVGTITLVVPDVPGPLTIDLRCGEIVNSYTSSISSI